jgi:ribonucleoside-diphosphate reductase beta chain
VSFACSFAFAERKLMEGNAKIIRLIARDEALHLTGPTCCCCAAVRTPEMRNRRRVQAGVLRPVRAGGSAGERVGRLPVPRRLHDWPEQSILCQYVEYITNIRMQARSDLPFQTL